MYVILSSWGLKPFPSSTNENSEEMADIGNYCVLLQLKNTYTKDTLLTAVLADYVIVEENYKQ